MFQPLFAIPIAVLSLSQPIPQKITIKIFPHLQDYPPEGLDADPAQVTLQSDSACRIYEGALDSASSTGVLQSEVKSLDLTLTDAGLPTPLWIQCSGHITVIRRGVKTSYSYGGPIYAHSTTTGPELIEVKTLNDYLKGVVPSEMPASWPEEALQAQAVAARTYAVFHMLLARETAPLGGEETGDEPLFDVDDTVFYQAYTGETDRTASSDQAVDETGQAILTYHRQVIQAYFSADAGGYTEDADHVWPVSAPYCQAKPEPFEDPGLDNGRWGPWAVKLSLRQLNRRLEAEGLISGANPVSTLWIEPDSRYVSGRASVVTIGLVDGTVADLSALAFQHALGLKSTLITLNQHAASGLLEINGRGFGHGVGMSQYGARLAALNGWSHSDILNFYYTDIRLCKITPKGALSCPGSRARRSQE